MRIVFLGTPKFVIPISEALLNLKNFKLIAVVTSPDKPVGRKQTLTPSPVKQWALTHKIPVLTPENLDENFKSSIINHKLDIGVLAAFGKIIPKELIDFFPKGILVIHPSLLPKYRGASPVQAAIINGDKETGVTIIKMDEKMDHGPIVSQFTEPMKEDDTAETLYSRLFQKAAEVLATILPNWAKGKIEPREQNHREATFTKTLKRQDGLINLDNPPSPEVFERMVRAYHPWPGVWTRQIINHKSSIIKFLPDQKVQLEGKKPVSWEQFQEAYPKAKEWVLKLYLVDDRRAQIT